MYDFRSVCSVSSMGSPSTRLPASTFPFPKAITASSEVSNFQRLEKGFFYTNVCAHRSMKTSKYKTKYRDINLVNSLTQRA